MSEDTNRLALATRAEERGRPPVAMGLAPRTLEEGWRLAVAFSGSELVPTAFRGKPENTLVAMQLGMELGLAPMQALQSIAVVNGRPSVWGDGFLALVMGAPQYEDHDEYYEVKGERRDGVDAADLAHDTTCAVCWFKRHNKATPVVRRFSVAQAKKAGLWGKSSTPWTTYPDRMLLMRARSWAGRDCFPDVLRGIRTFEEAIDEPVENAPVAVREQPRALVPVDDALEPPPASPAPVTMPPASPAVRPEPVDITADLPLLDPPPSVTVTDVQARQRGDKVWWVVTFSDGTSASTFSRTLSEQAMEAQKLAAGVRPQLVEAFGRPNKLVGLGV